METAYSVINRDIVGLKADGINPWVDDDIRVFVTEHAANTHKATLVAKWRNEIFGPPYVVLRVQYKDSVYEDMRHKDGSIIKNGMTIAKGYTIVEYI